MAFASGIRGVETGIADRMAAVAAQIRDRWRRHRVYRETVRELGGLGERDLADLGIHRSQIRSIAAEAAYGG
jgi:uncharacterized protein YjiS (DUF1127 family)